VRVGGPGDGDRARREPARLRPPTARDSDPQELFLGPRKYLLRYCFTVNLDLQCYYKNVYCFTASKMFTALLLHSKSSRIDLQHYYRNIYCFTVNPYRKYLPGASRNVTQVTFLGVGIARTGLRPVRQPPDARPALTRAFCHSPSPITFSMDNQYRAPT
jgi:hypothetical protein